MSQLDHMRLKALVSLVTPTASTLSLEPSKELDLSSSDEDTGDSHMNVLVKFEEQSIRIIGTF